jgi:serine/threonine protein kinase
MPRAAGTTHVGGRYRIDALLGRGGMAEVYDGVDLRLQRPVAIKLLREDLAVQPQLRARFEREGRAAARLNHPAVVAIYDTGEEDGIPFLVMERLSGGTLADRMARGPLDQDWLRRVVVQILSALGAAHAAGVLHRDIKPGNVLLDADGTAKVADFGIAAIADPSTSRADPASDSGELMTAAGQVLGTPAYLAPERLEGAPATVQTDLYSVGVLLYEGLTGRQPFAGPTPLATAVAALSEPSVPIRRLRPDADPRLAGAAERAMSRRPDQRFGSAAEMSAALFGPATRFGAATLFDPAVPVPPARPAAPVPPLRADATAVLPVVAPGRPAAPDRPAAPPVRQKAGRGGAVARTLAALAVSAALIVTTIVLWPFSATSGPGTLSPTTTSTPVAPTTSTLPVVVPPPTTTTIPDTTTSTTAPKHKKKRPPNPGGGGQQG